MMYPPPLLETWAGSPHFSRCSRKRICSCILKNREIDLQMELSPCPRTLYHSLSSNHVAFKPKYFHYRLSVKDILTSVNIPHNSSSVSIVRVGSDFPIVW